MEVNSGANRFKKIRVTMEKRPNGRYTVTAINGALKVGVTATVTNKELLLEGRTQYRSGLVRRLIGVGDDISEAEAAEIEKLRFVTVSVKLAKGGA